ncbi:MAG: hypothetical protein ACFNM6_09105, partial [Prevotella sp.]
MNNNLNEQPISQTESQEEKVFAGFTLNGFAALVMILAAYGVVAYTLNIAIDTDNTVPSIGSTVLGICASFCLKGFIQQEPNAARVMMFFGKYKGTFKKVGFFWVNPFISTKRLS